MTTHPLWLPSAGPQLVTPFLRIARLGARLRAACAAALLSVVAVPAAMAGPTLSWTLAPELHVSGSSGDVDVRGTLLNTGSETIVAINYLQVFTGTLGPYITNWAWNMAFWDDYNNANGGGLLDIDPGETFDFYIATISYANVPAGLYTAVSNVAIGVLSAGGEFSGAVGPANTLSVQVPQPPALALAVVALLGLGLARRRRPAVAN